MVKEDNIFSFTPSKNTFNAGSKNGLKIIERSIQKLGLGRSILVDKNDNIINGNKVYLKAIEAGVKKVIVVETNGDELVVVKRKDIDINSTKGVEMQFVDNLSCEQNLVWDMEQIKTVMNIFWGFDPRSWGASLSWEEQLNIDDFFKEIEEDKKRQAKPAPNLEFKQLSLFDEWGEEYND